MAPGGQHVTPGSFHFSHALRSGGKIVAKMLNAAWDDSEVGIHSIDMRFMLDVWMFFKNFNMIQLVSKIHPRVNFP